MIIHIFSSSKEDALPAPVCPSYSCWNDPIFWANEAMGTKHITAMLKKILNDMA